MPTNISKYRNKKEVAGVRSFAMDLGGVDIAIIHKIGCSI